MKFSEYLNEKSKIDDILDKIKKESGYKELTVSQALDIRSTTNDNLMALVKQLKKLTN